MMMKLGPIVLMSVGLHQRMRDSLIRCIDMHESVAQLDDAAAVDFGGIKISRDLVPDLVDLADGAHVLTRTGRRLKLERAGDTFVIRDLG